MLSIKHIEDGHESICLASHVSFYAKKEGDEQREAVLRAFGVGAASVSQDDHNAYSSGTVYVMNDQGATVGRYYFG